MGRYELDLGVKPGAAKAVFYGPEGIGKSTLAAKMPDPVFVDVEGGTNQLPVARLPRPTSWSMLLDEVRAVRDGDVPACRTLVIDTADAAEALCKTHVMAKRGWESIEQPGYGKGFTEVVEEFAHLLDLLSEVAEHGTNAVLLGHSIVANVTRPDETAYTTFSLNLVDRRNASDCALVKQWADMVLFLDYKVYVTVGRDGKGRAEGGARVVRTTHGVTWDAKNRFGLPDEMPLDDATAERIASLMAGGPSAQDAPARPAEAARGPEPPLRVQRGTDVGSGPEAAPQGPAYPERLRPLADLMAADGVTDAELRRATGERGTFPEECPVERYPQDYVGFLVSHWGQVVAKVRAARMRGDAMAEDLPFGDPSKAQ